MLGCIQDRKFNKYDALKVFRLHTETFLNIKKMHCHLFLITYLFSVVLFDSISTVK